MNIQKAMRKFAILITVLFVAGMVLQMCRPIPVNGVVVATDDETVSVVVDDGNMYAFYGDGYAEGDEITLLMNGKEIKGVLEND